MSLINQAVSSLFNGVSQQAPSIRSTSQGELQENGYSTIAEGLSKRPASEYVANLSGAIPDNAYVHIVDRDPTEKYVLIMTSGDVKAYDLLTGAALTVNAGGGFGYLTCGNPREDLAAVTAGDTTFIINKTRSILQGSTVSGAINTGIGFVYVRNPVAYATYTITVNGITATFTEDGIANDTCNQLQIALQAVLPNPPYAVYRPAAQQSTLLQIVHNSGSVNITTSDSYGGTGLVNLSTPVRSFSELPSSYPDGGPIQIKGAPNGTGGAYWVRNNSTNWEETIAPNMVQDFSESNPPCVQIVNPGGGTLSFGTPSFSRRLVGDDTSNPFPSFVGKTPTDLFFYRNRFGIAAGEQVCLSRSGDYLNFFAETATAVLDSDPIDIGVSQARISEIRHVVPFNTAALLFSDRTQFQLTAGDVLGPKSVRMDQTTEFFASRKCRPVVCGPNVYFPADRGKFSALREYFVSSEAAGNDASDITAHVPQYVPSGVFKLVSSTTEDILFALTTQERNALYCYKFYWSGEEKAQSAWFKFTFAADDKIMGAEMIGSDLYMVILRPDGLFVEKMRFQVSPASEPLKYPVLLDSLVLRNGSYDSATDETTWTLPYSYWGALEAVIAEGNGSLSGTKLAGITRPASNLVRVSGNYGGLNAYIGKPYTMRYRFSTQYVRDKNGLAISTGRLQLRTFKVRFKDAGPFRAEVTPKGRATNVYRHSSMVLGSILLGGAEQKLIPSGVFSFPVLSHADTVQIDLVNDSPLPSTFQAAEWVGIFSTQAKRI